MTSPTVKKKDKSDESESELQREGAASERFHQSYPFLVQATDLGGQFVCWTLKLVILVMSRSGLAPLDYSK